MTTWSLFATLYAGLITPLMAQLQAMIGTVCATMQPIALVMLTIWLAVVGADIAFGHKTLPAACKDFAVAACVIILLQAGQYTQYISNLFLTAVPHTVGAALLGGTTSPAAGLDKVLNLAWTEGWILVKPPSAELRENQKDEDSLPPYPVLDGILHGLVEKEMRVADIIAEGFDPDTVRRVEKLLYLAEYKRRQSAPGVKVGPKNFGRDRRYPIVNRFRDPGLAAQAPDFSIAPRKPMGMSERFEE